MSLLSPSPRLMPERIAAALGGRPSGNGYACRCPCHHDRHASLSLWIGDGGRLSVHCHAGCPRDEIIAVLAKRGLWHRDARLTGADLNAHRMDMRRYAEEQRRHAAGLWRESVPLDQTPGAHYLAHWRGIGIAPERLPRLRWHWRECAIVALVTDPATDAFRGVGVTLLDRLTDRKRTRLTFGRAGIVRLLDGGPSARLLIGEGAETVLSGALFLADEGGVSAWATLGAGGLERVRPPPSTAITLLIDRDASGRGERACRRAAERLTGLGHSIDLAFPPPGCGDFNDCHRRKP